MGRITGPVAIPDVKDAEEGDMDSTDYEYYIDLDDGELIELDEDESPSDYLQQKSSE